MSVNTIFYIQFSFVTFQESNYFCMYRHNALSEGHGFISLSIPFDLLPQCQTKMAVPAFWDSERVFAPQNTNVSSKKTFTCIYTLRKQILKSSKPVLIWRRFTDSICPVMTFTSLAPEGQQHRKTTIVVCRSVTGESK